MYLVTEASEWLVTEDEYYLITESPTIRGKILDAFVDALENISIANGYNTNVNYVSETLTIQHPNEIDAGNLPACFPIDDTEQKEQLATLGVDVDMKSTLTVIVTSVVYSRSGSTADQRAGLLQDVEKAIVTNTTLFNRATGEGLLLEPASPISVDTDKGYFGSYSVFDQSFECEYVYNFDTGG